MLRSRWGSRLTVSNKDAFDYVTGADRQAEEAVLGVIRERHPGHALLAEESEAGHWEELCWAEGVTWVVDPLDGTTNFIHGFPHVAVSVAAVSQGKSLAGVVVDVTREEEFRAMRGAGAFLGEARLAVSAQTDPARALLCTRLSLSRPRPAHALPGALPGAPSPGKRRALGRGGGPGPGLRGRRAGRGLLGNGAQALGLGGGHPPGGGGRGPGERLRRRERDPPGGATWWRPARGCTG